jgi:hypothetical protein
MRKTNLRLGVVFVGAACIAMPLMGPTVAQAQSPAPTVVVSGLNNPRELSLTANGDLLVAEAGNGGSTKLGNGKNAQFVGPSGSVTLVRGASTASNQSPKRILTGFLSAASANGSGAVGSDGVSAQSLAHIYVQETWAPPPLPPFFGDQLGELFGARPHGVPTAVANISAFNQANDPDGQPFDSDPYGVLAYAPGKELVADAASNDVLTVNHGTVSLFHVFPNITTGRCAKKSDPNPQFPGCNFVPTALARNAKGDVFVTGLGSLVPGEGEIVELDPTGQTVMHTWSGFDAPVGIVLDHRGDIWVSQLFAPEANPPAPGIAGVVTEITTSGAQSNMDVPFPSGLAMGRAGNLYVSAFSIAPGSGLGGPGTSGQVWRINVGAG